MGRKRNIEYDEEYKRSQMGRAVRLLARYKQTDKEANRGECDFNARWIVENIFSKPCAHCGETDWHKLGCNRINNDLPHIKNNVESCCRECNLKLEGKNKKKVYQYNLEKKLIKVWECAYECAKYGFSRNHISECCNNLLKSHKGYIWSYVPL